ncbi:MAG: PAS domain S-box protein [bacterium]|nr:PAS domain S-box protein [bacterium]
MELKKRPAINKILEQEKTLAENILKAIPDGFNIIDRNCDIIYQNKVLQDFFGAEAIGKKCYEVYKDDKRQCDLCPLKRPIKVGQTQTIEVSGVMNGKTFLISHSGIKLNGGEQILEVYRDITDYRKIEEKLLNLSRAVEQSHASIVITDIDGNIQYVNPYFLETTGYSWNEAIGQNPRILKSDVQPKEMYRELWKTIKAGQAWQGEFCNKKKNGELYWERVSVSPVKNTAGMITSFVAVKEDFTEQRNDRERLAQEHKIIDTIIENTDMLLVYFDSDFNYIWVNSAYAAFCGLNAKELTGKNYFALFPDQGNEILFRRARSNGEIVKVKARAVSFDGQPQLGVTYWDWQLTPIKDSGGAIHGFVYSTTDVTENKTAEDEKNNFIAIMSHELRSPLSPILTSAQLINAHLSDIAAEDKSSAIGQAAKMIEKQSKIMARLLDDLLDITRINQGKIKLKTQALELVESLDNAIGTARRLAAEQKQTFSVSLPAEPVYIKADPVRLEQIVINLLNNAIRFTPAGGQIRLEARQLPGALEIRVRDTGIGIEKTKLSSIFNLFAGTPRAYISAPGELGIGLKLIKNLATAHGGTITANSLGLNQGSEFIVKLPVLLPDYSPDNAGQQARLTAADKLRLLIIDDNKDIADMQAELFNFYGYDTRVSYDGQSALAIAADYKPQVALVDIGLPVMDGYQVAGKLKEMADKIGQKIKLIAATGYGQDEDKRRSRQAGFDHHFVKPVDFDALLKVLKEI